MGYYKISMEVGKKLNIPKIIFVKRHKITEALDVSNKVHGGRLCSIVPITQQEYEAGVAEKYDDFQEKEIED